VAESKLVALFRELVNHSGFAELRIEIRTLRQGEKREVLLSAGRQYRFIIKPVPKEKPN